MSKKDEIYKITKNAFEKENGTKAYEKVLDKITEQAKLGFYKITLEYPREKEKEKLYVCDNLIKDGFEIYELDTYYDAPIDIIKVWWN